jgi:hypothetical protein
MFSLNVSLRILSQKWVSVKYGTVGLHQSLLGKYEFGSCWRNVIAFYNVSQQGLLGRDHTVSSLTGVVFVMLYS